MECGRYVVTVAHEENGRRFDPGIRRILEELRDLRLESRADRRQAEVDRRQAEADRREFREASAHREAVTQKILKDIHAVGVAIVKTLTRHTRILERIDRKLGVRGNGGLGRPNGGRA